MIFTSPICKLHKKIYFTLAPRYEKKPLNLKKVTFVQCKNFKTLKKIDMIQYVQKRFDRLNIKRN